MDKTIMPEKDELIRLALAKGYVSPGNILWEEDGIGLGAKVIVGEALYDCKATPYMISINTPCVTDLGGVVSWDYDSRLHIISLPSDGLEKNVRLAEDIVKASNGVSLQRLLFNYYEVIGPMM